MSSMLSRDGFITLIMQHIMFVYVSHCFDEISSCQQDTENKTNQTKPSITFARSNFTLSNDILTEIRTPFL